MGNGTRRKGHKRGPKVNAIKIGEVRLKRTKDKEYPAPEDVLFRIQRGLSGFISFLAACEMNEAFSEYLLYEPMLRILTASKYHVKCEMAADGVTHAETGDKKKIDFVTLHDELGMMAIEAKWVRSETINVENDVLKLKAFRDHEQNDKKRRAFLVAFGTWSKLKNVQIKKFEDESLAKVHVIEAITPVYAFFFKTQYGCRVFEMNDAENAM